MKEKNMIVKVNMLPLMILAVVCWAVSSAQAGQPSASADILNVSPYARGTALADCLVADDSSFSLYYNPAGIAGTRGLVVGGAWNGLLGLDVMQAAGICNVPLAKLGVLGAALLYNSVGSIPVMTYQAGEVTETGATFSASDLVVRAGFSRMFGKKFSAGVSVKFLYGIIESVSAPAFCADAGIQIADLLPGLYAGLVVKNLGVGPKFQLVAAPLPMTVEAGFQYALLTGANKSPHFLAVYLQPSYLIQEGLVRVAVAAEYGLQKMYFFRIGYGLDAKSLYGLTFGAGIRYKITKNLAPRLDVSFIPDPVFGSKINVSFDLRI
jgi:opacity protein-like surface antigen